MPLDDPLFLCILLLSGTVLAALVPLIWSRPEYGLFVYGLAHGFPDVALPIGVYVHVRIDDLIIAAFVPYCLWLSRRVVTDTQRKMFRLQIALASLAATSGLIGLCIGKPPERPQVYDFMKFAGCVMITLFLPRMLTTSKRVLWLVSGLAIGGVALAIQVAQKFMTASARDLADFQNWKNSITFSSWNANTVGQAATLLVFAAGVGYLLCKENRLTRYLWFSLAILFSVIPFVVFARGAAITITIGFVLFLALTRNWKPVVCLLVCGLALMVLLKRSAASDAFNTATQVDLHTGVGLSGRYETWSYGLAAVSEDPLVGHGFALELLTLDRLGLYKVAHCSYLSVWIELGLAGFVIFLAIIVQYYFVALWLRRISGAEEVGALLLSVITTLALAALGLPTLYYEKLPTIALAIGIGLVGICESNMRGRPPAAFAYRRPWTALIPSVQATL